MVLPHTNGVVDPIKNTDFYFWNATNWKGLTFLQRPTGTRFCLHKKSIGKLVVIKPQNQRKVKKGSPLSENVPIAFTAFVGKKTFLFF